MIFEISALGIALILDRVVRDHELLWRKIPHPVVTFGAIIALAERLFYPRADHPHIRFVCGILAVIIPLITLVTLTYQAELWLNTYPIAHWIIVVLITTTMLAHGELWHQVTRVATALNTGDIILARQNLRHLVGRKRDELDSTQIARAAIESGAESYCDAVAAPIFWYLLGAAFNAELAALIAYKFINTCDSMIGYRSPRYAQFGTCAARLDDVVNWIPARISVVTIALSAVLKFGPRRGYETLICTDGKSNSSPNAGRPQAAVAAALQIRLGGPIAYPCSGKHKGHTADMPWYNSQGRDPKPEDIHRLVELSQLAWWCMLLIFAGYMIFEWSHTTALLTSITQQL